MSETDYFRILLTTYYLKPFFLFPPEKLIIQNRLKLFLLKVLCFIITSKALENVEIEQKYILMDMSGQVALSQTQPCEEDKEHLTHTVVF